MQNGSFIDIRKGEIVHTIDCILQSASRQVRINHVFETRKKATLLEIYIVNKSETI